MYHCSIDIESNIPPTWALRCGCRIQLDVIYNNNPLKPAAWGMDWGHRLALGKSPVRFWSIKYTGELINVVLGDATVDKSKQTPPSRILI